MANFLLNFTFLLHLHTHTYMCATPMHAHTHTHIHTPNTHAHSHKNIHKLGLCSGWWDIFGGRNLRNQSAESPPSDAISEHIRLSRVPPFVFVVTLYTTHSIAHLVNVNVLVLKVIQISNSYPRWQVSTLHILSNSVLVYPGVPMSIMVMSALAVVGTPLHGVNTPPRHCVHWIPAAVPPFNNSVFWLARKIHASLDKQCYEVLSSSS